MPKPTPLSSLGLAAMLIGFFTALAAAPINDEFPAAGQQAAYYFGFGLTLVGAFWTGFKLSRDKKK